MKTTRILSVHHRLFALAAVLIAFAPGRAAADPAAIFVSNHRNGSVPAYGATGAGATGYSTPGNFADPEGVAYNPANGMLYVADGSNDQIRTFNATTGAETQLGFANVTTLNGPIGLALNAGVLYAANSNTNSILAFNAATGAAVTNGFSSPQILNAPFGLAVNATTLYVTTVGNNSLGAYNLASGTSTFTISGLNGPNGVALFGNDLFVANNGGGTVGEYNATTGAVINASFVTSLSGPYGLAVLGNRLLVTNDNTTTVGAYGIPAVATNGNVPTSSTPSFLTGLGNPAFIAVIVPEPSTWALLGLGGACLLGLALRQRRVSGVHFTSDEMIEDSMPRSIS